MATEDAAPPKRASHKLVPLSNRKVRVRLLLESYLDAVEAVHEAVETAGAYGSKEPARNRELWRAGSYRPLERCLDTLRVEYRPVYRVTWDRFVLRGKEQNRGREQFGLALLAIAMPRNIYVPQVISENAGYGAQEAKRYARKVS